MGKTLIVAGAGASCDWPTVPDHNLVSDQENSPAAKAQFKLYATLTDLKKHKSPPLTKDLVRELRQQATGCDQLLQAIYRHQQNNLASFDFEETLRDIVDKKGKVFKEELLHLRTAIKDRMALANEIGEKHSTLYTQLYGSIKASDRENRDGSITVNLNYDRLAEFAITNRVGFTNFESYIRNNTGHQLYHPHGHCSWSLGKTNVQTSLAPERDNSKHQKVYIGNLTGGHPCLALPMSGDDEGKTAWPAFHREHLDVELQDVDEILIIGWRGNDKHIVKLIAGSIGHVKNFHIIGNSETGVEATKQNTKAWNKDDVTVITEKRGFRQYLNSSDSEFKNLFPL